MKKTNMILLPVIVLIFGTLVLVKCGNADNKPTVSPADTTAPAMGPAPDNNSANNPSLADTAYEKNRTRPITDTMKKH